MHDTLPNTHVMVDNLKYNIIELSFQLENSIVHIQSHLVQLRKKSEKLLTESYLFLSF